MKKLLILVCNSHIDPVWLWEWEEGVAETLSTFRTAVKFCEQNEDFAFCHNESLLYEWTEKFDPSLFERIKTQVRSGRWHIMGGWYLQPDCNMHLGESIIRQIITGKKYFLEKFGKEPHTAINLDSFGHSRGLVQILVAAGYDSYLFCRPDYRYLRLPDDTFQWTGFDGSKVIAHRAPDHYNSGFGLAGKKLKNWIDNPVNKGKETGILLWGIGNHGGGPSEKDVEEIRRIRNEETTWNIVHGTPEEYFSHFQEKTKGLQEFKGDLNPFAIGCYTSMKTVKQAVYRLEHEFYTAEKLLTVFSFCNDLEYPGVKMDEALKELLFCQFHDILPGTSVEPVEKDVLHRIGHASRIIQNETSALLMKTGNSLLPAQAGEFPLMLINPHPFDVDEIIETELQLPEPNLEKTLKRTPYIFNEEGESIPVQSEKPHCNIKEDHRKKVVFRAKIPAGKVRRFSCFLTDEPIVKQSKSIRNDLHFNSKRSELIIDKSAGFPVIWKYEDLSLFGPQKMSFILIDDNADPWGMGIKSFDGDVQPFELMSRSQASEFAGLPGEMLSSVYVSEDGEIRTVVESLFACNNSRIHIKYFVPVGYPGFEVEITVYWMEKNRLLKWLIPVGFDMNCVARSTVGINCFRERDREYVFRDWLGMKNFEGKNSFSICSDGSYGFDMNGNTVGISLLRSPAYSGHPVGSDQEIVMTDRAVKRIDQGVHTFRFRFIPGNTEELIDKSFNHSDLFNNRIISRIVYPTGDEQFRYSGIKISDEAINLQAIRLSENGDLVIRLLNPCKEIKRFTVQIPFLNAGAELELAAKSLRTWVYSNGKFNETDLLERVVYKDSFA